MFLNVLCSLSMMGQLKTRMVSFHGHASEILICPCSLFYRREVWVSKSASSNITKSIKICGCKRECPKDLWVCAPAAPTLAHSLVSSNVDQINDIVASNNALQCTSSKISGKSTTAAPFTDLRAQGYYKYLGEK